MSILEDFSPSSLLPRLSNSSSNQLASCGLPLSIAYEEGWSGQWLCAEPHPANTYAPLRPRAHTCTGSHWPCRSVRKVPVQALIPAGD